MLFPTIDFAVFFVIVFTGSWMLRPYAKVWRWFLLLASCVFYLDPFNPVATDGQEILHTNVVIAASIAAVAALTTVVLKAAFGTTGGADALPGGRRSMVRAARVAVDGGGGGAVDYRDSADDVDDGDRGGGDAAGRGASGFNAASVWAPLLVCAMVFGGDIVLSGRFSERPDQSWRFLF